MEPPQRFPDRTHRSSCGTPESIGGYGVECAPTALSVRSGRPNGEITALDSHSTAGLEPLGPSEAEVQDQAGGAHYGDYHGVAPLPLQLRHELEVHAIDAGNHRRHRDDTGPGRYLSHVVVLLHADAGQCCLDKRVEQVVVAIDMVGGLGLVVGEVAYVAPHLFGDHFLVFDLDPLERGRQRADAPA